jgi:hypothetical protein
MKLKPLPENQPIRKIIRLLTLFSALFIVLTCIDIFFRDRNITWGDNLGLDGLINFFYFLSEFQHLLPFRKNKKSEKNIRR